MNIVLIGYRGSGKSVVGKLLAARLGMAFCDTDEIIVAKAGKTIREIFAVGGEPAFRLLERDAVAQAARLDNTVIAAGGGVVLDPANISALKHSAKIVWLSATAEVLYQRISADAASQHTRPNLTTAGGLEEVKRLLARRTPLYQAAADITVDADNQTPEQLAWYLSQMV
ncbi:MAG: shikimate kinase [Phycisphaerales bacterium]|nr:shikimate kinase [Phycisphaerales bacterium]